MEDLRHPFYTFSHVITPSSKCTLVFYFIVRKQHAAQRAKLTFLTFNSQLCLCNYSCLHALHAPLQQSFTKDLSLNEQGCVSRENKKKNIYLWKALSKTVFFFHTSMQSGSNVIHCCAGWKKLNSFCGMTPFILSPGTDLLILKGQTGPIHNVTLECWGLSFHCNEKAIYWDDSC